MSISYDNRRGTGDLRLPPAPSIERPTEREIEVPNFKTREEWDRWRAGNFKNDQEFEAWRTKHRHEDIGYLRSAVPSSALEPIHRRGEQIADLATDPSRAELLRVRDPSLMQLIQEHPELAHHLVNPSLRNRPPDQMVWGALDIKKAEAYRPIVDRIAARHGLDFSGLNDYEVYQRLDELRAVIESDCPPSRTSSSMRRSSRYQRRSPEAAAEFKEIAKFSYPFGKALRLQQEKAEQLWAVAAQPRAERPDYFTTAGDRNRDGLAVAFRRSGPDNDGNGLGDGYDGYIARVRARHGSGLPGEQKQPSTEPAPGYRPGEPHITSVYRGRIVTPRRASLEDLPEPSNDRYRPPTSTYVSTGLGEYNHWKQQLDGGIPASMSGPQLVDFLFKHYALHHRNDPRVPSRGLTREEGAEQGLRLLAEEYKEKGNTAALDALRRTPGTVQFGLRPDDPIFNPTVDHLEGPGYVQREQKADLDRKQTAVLSHATDYFDRADFGGFRRYLNEQSSGVFTPEQKQALEQELGSQRAAGALLRGYSARRGDERWLEQQLHHLSLEQLDTLKTHHGALEIAEPRNARVIAELFEDISAYRDRRAATRETAVAVIADISSGVPPRVLDGQRPEQIQLVAIEASHLLSSPGNSALPEPLKTYSADQLSLLRQTTVNYLSQREQMARETPAPEPRLDPAPAVDPRLATPTPERMPERERQPEATPFALQMSLDTALSWYESYRNSTTNGLDEALNKVIAFKSRRRVNDEELAAMSSALQKHLEANGIGPDDERHGFAKMLQKAAFTV